MDRNKIGAQLKRWLADCALEAASCKVPDAGQSQRNSEPTELVYAALALLGCAPDELTCLAARFLLSYAKLTPARDADWEASDFRTINATVAQALVANYADMPELQKLSALVSFQDPSEAVRFWDGLGRAATSREVEAHALRNGLIWRRALWGDLSVGAIERESLAREVEAGLLRLNEEFGSMPDLEPLSDAFGLRFALARQERMPDAVFDLAGRRIHLPDHRGTVLFLFFSASWCRWCTSWHQVADGLARRFSGHVSVLSCTTLEAMQKCGADHCSGAPVTGALWVALPSPAFANWDVRSFPTFLLIGADGRFMARPHRPTAAFVRHLEAQFPRCAIGESQWKSAAPDGL